jgi:hypothetical protein
MSSKTGWMAAGLLALIILIVGISNLSAQRFGTAGSGHGDVGRYVLVRNTDDALIIMDSASGDLFKATPADIKSFAARHGPVEGKKAAEELVPDRFKDEPKLPDIKPVFKDKDK